MKKITLHWTVGRGDASEYERSRYHFLIESTGKVVEGHKPPEANRSPLGSDYVAHCGGFNSDNIGVALCGMSGARERPFKSGAYPLRQSQFRKGVELIADLCETYNIKPSRNTVFMHSEVLGRFGRGKYKWDVNWIEGMKEPADPVKMGDYLRKEVQKELNSRKKKLPDWWVRLMQAFNRSL